MEDARGVGLGRGDLRDHGCDAVDGGQGHEEDSECLQDVFGSEFLLRGKAGSVPEEKGGYEHENRFGEAEKGGCEEAFFETDGEGFSVGAAMLGCEDGFEGVATGGGSAGTSGLKKMKGKWGRRYMTVVIITHAREMMMLADEIVVLEKGRVVEVGEFYELAERREGVLRRLLRMGEWDGGGGESFSAYDNDGEGGEDRKGKGTAL